jgi:hypothetical protein
MPVKAPSNYKKPEAIAKYIEERTAELAGGAAAEHLLVGTVAEIAVIEGDKSRTLKQSNDIADFFKFAVDEATAGRGIIGYKIHKAMRLLAVMNAVRGETFGSSIPMGYFGFLDELYNRPYGFIDPVSLWFGSSDIDLTAAATRLHVSVNPESSLSLAEFARMAMRNVDLGEA